MKFNFNFMSSIFYTHLCVTHVGMSDSHTHEHAHTWFLTLHIRQNWLWELERSHRSFVVCLTGSHMNLKSPMGTWKVSREPCDMSYRVSWELGRSLGSLVICHTESHGNLKGLMGTWKCLTGSLVICLTGSHGNLKGLMGTWRVSWELEESHGNLKSLTKALWYVLQGLMGTWRVSWELERSHGSLVICLTGSHVGSHETLKVS